MRPNVATVTLLHQLVDAVRLALGGMTDADVFEGLWTCLMRAWGGVDEATN